MAIDLPLIWAAIVGLAVAMYVVLDGFDLGIGLLLGFTDQAAERDQMVNAIVPFWDGNETWLVLGGGALWVAFPRAYAVIMPAFYVPVIAMLLALVFRGVAFEFRNLAVAGKSFWDYALIGGSALAALCQGAILGGLIICFLEAIALFASPAMIAIPARFNVATTQLYTHVSDRRRRETYFAAHPHARQPTSIQDDSAS